MSAMQPATAVTKSAIAPAARRLAWAAPVAAILLIFGGTASQARDIRLECDATGPNDISMHSRYEERDSGRKRFTAEFEARPGGAFSAGQRMVVLVEGVRVGADTLESVVGGDIVGDLNLDTTAGPGDEAKPFPSNFPEVDVGSRVVIRIGGANIIGCRLRR